MDLVLKKGPSHKTQEPLIVQYVVDGKKETRKVMVGDVAGDLFTITSVAM